MQVEAKVEIVKDKLSYILAYPIIGKDGFWNNPFKILNKYKIIAINRLDGEYINCDICGAESEIVFAFISVRRLKNKKVDNWTKMCPSCCEIYLNLNKMLNDESAELCKSFLHKICNDKN